MAAASKSSETRQKISELSVRVEDVLLRLLSETDDLRDRLEAEVRDREREVSDVRERLQNAATALNDALNKEKR